MPQEETVALRKAKNLNPTVADILARVSTRKQEDSNSLITQRAGCEHFATAHGLTVHHVYEVVYSAEEVDFLDHPGVQAVFRDLEQHTVGNLILYDVDRTGRDLFVGVNILQHCEMADARLYIAHMPDLDLSTTMGKMFFVMKVLQGKEEINSIRERSNRNKRAKAEDGLPYIGPVPRYGWLPRYGLYRGKRRKVANDLDPYASAVVTRIWQMAKDGTTQSGIADVLDAESVLCPSAYFAAKGLGGRRKVGTGWNTSAVHRILTEPCYWGEAESYRRISYKESVYDEFTGRTRTRIVQRLRTAEDELPPVPIGPDVWPAIITDPALVAAVHARLAANQEDARGRTSHKEEALLRGGYVVCGHCGRPMIVSASGHRDRQGYLGYVCRRTKSGCGTSITLPSANDLVRRFLALLAERPDVAEQTLDHWRAAHGAVAEALARDIRTAEETLADAQTKMTNLTAHIAALPPGDTTVQDALMPALRAVTQARTGALKRLAELRKRQEEDPHAAHVQTTHEWAAEWRERMGTATVAEQRQWLYRLGVRLVVFRSDVPERLLLALGLFSVKALGGGKLQTTVSDLPLLQAVPASGDLTALDLQPVEVVVEGEPLDAETLAVAVERAKQHMVARAAEAFSTPGPEAGPGIMSPSSPPSPR
jgi:site-specific DNA recombinase